MKILAYSITITAIILSIVLCVVRSQTFASRLSIPPKMIVIGLDGATWDLLTPWMEQGLLPNLQHIQNQGVSSTLISMDPMSSPSLWTTICTGVSPAKHGVSGFFSTRADLKAVRIWDVMAGNGIKVGLFGWLLSFPPETKFAFCVPAWMAHSPETHPMSYSFVQEINIDQALDGGLLCPVRVLYKAAKNGGCVGSIEQMSWFYLQDSFGMSDETRLAKKMLAETPLQTDVFLHLLRKYQPDVSSFSFYGSDKLAHRFWHDMQPEAFADQDYQPRHEFQHVIQSYYCAADEAIGRILKQTDENTTIVVLSDHGMKADPVMPRQFFLDTQQLLHQMNLTSVFRHHTIMRQTFLEPVINNPLLLEETKSALQSFRFEDGSSLFRVIIENDKIVLQTNFSLTWSEDSPLITNKTILYAEQTIPTDELFFLRTFSGTHDINGIFMMMGPHIQQDITIQPPQLTDIAPTLLFILNQPISREIEGRIIQEAFLPDWYALQDAQYVEAYHTFSDGLPLPQNSEALLERLRSMGYVE